MNERKENEMIVGCFFALADTDRQDIMINDEKIESYNIIDNYLIINGKKIKIKDVSESLSGNILLVNDYILMRENNQIA